MLLIQETGGRLSTPESTATPGARMQLPDILNFRIRHGQWAKKQLGQVIEISPEMIDCRSRLGAGESAPPVGDEAAG